jgi:hypothetical protein
MKRIPTEWQGSSGLIPDHIGDKVSVTGSVQQRHQAMLRLKLWTTNMYRYLNNQSNTDRQSANQIFDRDERVPLANPVSI